MERPDQFVVESKKNRDWQIDNIKYYGNFSTDQSSFSDIGLWRKYYGIETTDEFSYLTEIVDEKKATKYTLPAIVRKFPIQRHFIDSLISQKTRRNFIFSSVLVSESEIEQKHTDKFRQFTKQILFNAEQKHYLNRTKLDQLDMKTQQIQSMLSQQPKSEEEMQRNNQLREQLPMIMNQIALAKDFIESEDLINQDQIDVIKRNQLYDDDDYKKDIAIKTAQYLRKRLDAQRKSVDSFRNDVVGGKHFFFVDYNEGDILPEYKVLNTNSVVYPQISNTDYIQDGPWCKIISSMSPTDVISIWGSQIKEFYGEEGLQDIMKSNLSSDSLKLYVVPGEGAGYSGEHIYTGEGSTEGSKVEYIYYKVPRKIHVKKSLNNYGRYIRHFFSNDKEIIDVANYNFENGKYVSKADKNIMYTRKDVHIYDSRKKDELIVQYTQDLYTGVIINNTYFVDVRLKKEIYRSPEKHSDIKLPVIGWMYNDFSRQPYSLVGATSDLEKLFRIVQYHKELMLAVSGTNSVLFDRSQKPSDLTDAEWEYQKKTGTIHIETGNKIGEPPKSGHFNQWQNIDLSLSGSIQYLEIMSESIKTLMGEIIGVPRPRIGEVVNSDQVGTYKESIERAYLVTEILYYNHDVIEAKAMTQLVNLALKFPFKDGKILEIINDDMSTETFDIPKAVFKDLNIDIIISNNADDEAQVKAIKDSVINEYKKGSVMWSDMVSVWNINSLVELSKKVLQLDRKARKLAEDQQNSQKDALMSIEEAKKQAQQELQQLVGEQNAYIAKMKGEFELTKQQMLTGVQNKKLELESKLGQNQNLLKMFELINEKNSEDQVLMYNDKNASLDRKLKAVELQLNTIMNAIGLYLQDDKQEKDFTAQKTKIASDKAVKMVKEHASDK